MSTQIEKENKVCKGCGSEYEAHIGHIMDTTIRLDQGYCPECRRKLAKEEEKREADNRLQELSSIREGWRVECGLPMRFRNCRFDNFDMKVDRSIKQVYKECVEFSEKFSFHNPQISKSLFFYSSGVWGLGKTFLSCAVANAILDKWNDEVSYCPVLFTSEPSLFLRIRSTFNRQTSERPQETEQDIYNKLTKVPLLILDDVGKEEVADARFVQRVLFAVIDGRYQNMLPIILTANLTPDELDAHLGGSRGNSASMDRLLEMTGSTAFEMRGQTYRDRGVGK